MAENALRFCVCHKMVYVKRIDSVPNKVTIKIDKMLISVENVDEEAIRTIVRKFTDEEYQIVMARPTLKKEWKEQVVLCKTQEDVDKINANYFSPTQLEWYSPSIDFESGKISCKKKK